MYLDDIVFGVSADGTYVVWIKICDVYRSDVYGKRHYQNPMSGELGVFRDILVQCPILVVDLRQTEYLDSTGLGFLIGLLKRRRERGLPDIQLVTSGPRIQRIFEITGLNRLFIIFHESDINVFPAMAITMESCFVPIKPPTPPQGEGITVAEAGRKGGSVTFERHGPTHMAKIGKEGGDVTSQRHGPAFYREIGAKGRRNQNHKRPV